MNQIIKKNLLTGDTFMPEMHIRQPGFTYSACGLFTKHKKEFKNSCKQEKKNDIYGNELDKACFAHDAAYI